MIDKKTKELNITELEGKTLIFEIELSKKHSELNHSPAEVQIKFIDGEYQYYPRYGTFASDTTLDIDELKAIISKLKLLNETKYDIPT